MAQIQAKNGQTVEVNVKELLASITPASQLNSFAECLNEKSKMEKIFSDLEAKLGSDDLIPQALVIRYNQIDKKHMSLITDAGIKEQTPEFKKAYFGEEPETAQMVETKKVAPVSIAGFTSENIQSEVTKLLSQGKKVIIKDRNEEIVSAEAYTSSNGLESFKVVTTAGVKRAYYIKNVDKVLEVVG